MDNLPTLPYVTPLFWISAISAVVLVGISKAGFAGGVGVVATPLLALTIPVADAAALLLPLLIVIDIFNVVHYRRDVDRHNLRLLLPAAIVGIVLGALFFNRFSADERLMKLGIGVIAVAFVVYQVGRRAIFGRLADTSANPLAGGLLGVVAGFTSTLAHVGGPPLAVYLLPQRLPRRVYVGTVTYFFFVVNLVKLIPYGMLGLLRTGNITTTLLLLPFTYVGVRLGHWLNARFDERWFLIAIYVLLLLTGIQLILGRTLLVLITG